MPARVLIAGVSTRATASSAARAGFDVISLDAFADLDHPPSVRALSMPRDFGVPFTPTAAATVARTIASDAVVYLSGFENHPRAVAVLAEGRRLWGNTPAVLRKVRDPFELAAVCRRLGFRAPLVRNDPNDANDPRWLLKPLASGGGHGVRLWQPGSLIGRGTYLQEFVEGTPASVSFVAAGRRAVPIGVSEQLVGESAFGASGFRYCGSILRPAATMPGGLMDRLTALADGLAEAFELRGVGCVDVVLADGEPWPIEVNPRWSASMELMERASGVSVFSMHAEACERSVLPAWRSPGSSVCGKAVVFARQPVIVGDTRRWLEDRSVGDVPRVGERMLAGQPVCTVFAEGRDEAACRSALDERARRVYDDLAGFSC